ncbi:TerD family protein [Paraburkholderia aspalathi]|nr:TerD family protein [Paraburkholderia aspalathi]MBK3780182.1 TerD family protein [Paraburkholderia aspalathi]
MLTLGDTHFAVNSREFNILAALLRNGKLALQKCISQESALGHAGPQLGSVLHSQLMLESLGFAYSKDVILAMSWLPEADVAHVHTNLKQMLTRALGAHHVFSPMYPNFPEQVLAVSDLELLVNAWMHYAGDWFGVRILPKYVEARRAPLKMLAHTKPAVLALCDDTEYFDHFLRLLNGNASLSAANRSLVLDLLSCQLEYDPDTLLDALKHRVTIPQKETRALVGGWMLQNSPATFEAAEFARLFQTPTDVLRLATAVSARDLVAADLSLSEPQRFGKLSRGVRRLLLALLDAQDAESVCAEMFRRREQWVRLGEVLHPGEYQSRFLRAYDHFTALRNNLAPVSWVGSLEKRIASRDTLAAIALLSQRPGVFARKLHEVVRKATGTNKEAVVKAFAGVADKVSTPVLVQLRQRMLVEADGVNVQAFSPKAGAGRMWVPQEAAKRLTDGLAESIVNTVSDVLAARFAKLPAMGKVYIDPALAGYSVPFSQRTAQKALHTVGRGSRIDLGDEKIMRAFLWWNESGIDKNGEHYTIDRTDLDLSCTVLDESFQYVDHCSFTQLRTQGLTHSGDITSAPNGACEFIDIDFEQLPESAAYIALIAFSYTRQNFGDMPEAYLGWMARADGQSGDIYDARTVRQKVDLSASGERLLVGYVDVPRRQFVWADLVVPARCDGFNAVETSTIMTGVLARGIVEPIRPTLGVLLADHALARGELVANPEDADIVFTSKLPGIVAPVKDGQKVVTAYDAEVLIADYLA